jgi:hypothetical protein
LGGKHVQAETEDSVEGQWGSVVNGKTLRTTELREGVPGRESKEDEEGEEVQGKRKLKRKSGKV